MQSLSACFIAFFFQGILIVLHLLLFKPPSERHLWELVGTPDAQSPLQSCGQTFSGSLRAGQRHCSPGYSDAPCGVSAEVGRRDGSYFTFPIKL